jgi:predicted O-methyltransferase YrrM
MNQEMWTAIDQYFNDALMSDDPVLDAALEASDAGGLPQHNVAPNQGKLLMLLAQMQGARRILEIGTLGGYSTIWMARALPQDGKLITLEYEPMHAEVARANIANAGLGDEVDIRVGAAIDTLPQLAAEAAGPFDLIFIDADKRGNRDYFRWALTLSRVGTVIIVDNVARGGAVVDPNGDESVQGVRRLTEMLAKEPRVSATAIQTVGSKGYDGFILARVLAL